MIKVFESERINFIKIDPNLINDYLKMINDEETQKFIGETTFTVTFDQEMNWVKDNMIDGLPIFSMIEKDTNEFIGNIDITIKDENTGELGICITKDKWNKHFGTESIKIMLEYGYNELKLKNIYLNVHKDNPRAIKCYENCGFKITGEGKLPSDYHMIHQKELNND